MSVSLNVIFNHPYIKNIDILEKIYRPRFPKLKYLVPFVKDRNPDILTVYRGSYNYHGYIADKVEELKQENVTHYVFIQDDLLLTPSVNSHNFTEKLNLSSDEGYVSWLFSLNQELYKWPWNQRVLLKMNRPNDKLYGSGAENFTAFLPKPELAKKQLEKYQISMKPFKVNYEQLIKAIFRAIANKNWNQLLANVNVLVNQERNLTYPLAFSGSRSDFFVVPSQSFEQFAHILGVLAGGEIFAEASIGTALALSIQTVKTQTNCQVISDWRLDKRNLKFSNENDIKEIKRLFFEEKNFLLHPIKLSYLLNHQSSLDKFLEIYQ